MSAVLKAQEPSARYLAALRPGLVEHFDLVASAPASVARLRELILTLAVRGKLVAQDPGDEPATGLLSRIQAARDRFARADRRKRLALPPMDDDERPFDIPSTWCWVRLGEITNYGSPDKAGNLQRDTWVVDLEDIEKTSGRLLSRVRFGARSARSDKNSFSRGDVLYGKLRPYLNKVLVADEDGVCTTEIVPFRCFGEFVAGYFKLAISSPYFLSYVNARSYGMKMPRLGTEDARRAPFPLPPLNEQTRIVARVEELMHLCDALEAKGRLEDAQHAQLLDTLSATLVGSGSPEELAANWQRIAAHFDLLLDRPRAIDVLEASFIDLGLRGALLAPPQDGPSADDALAAMAAQISKYKNEYRAPVSRVELIDPSGVPFDLPRNWRWVRLDAMCKVITDGDHLPPPKSEAGVAFLTIGNISSGEISFADCRFVPQEYFDRIAVYRRPAKGDLLYTVVGATYGRPVLVQSDQPFCVQRHIAILKPATAGIEVTFLRLVLKSSFAYAQATRGITGTAQPTVPLSALRNYILPLPPLDEQRRIVARVDELRRLCADLREKLASAQTTQARLADALVKSAGSAD